MLRFFAFYLLYLLFAYSKKRDFDIISDAVDQRKFGRRAGKS